MGLAIHFYFTIQHDESWTRENWNNSDFAGKDEGGEYVCANMAYSTFHDMIYHECTAEQLKEWGLFDDSKKNEEEYPEIFYGDFVSHVWEWCKEHHLVYNSQDKRIPLKMKFC